MSRRSASSTKVFIGSLPAGTTVDELKNLFAPYGEVAEADVVNRCGFMHLEDKTLAMKAIQELHNSNFKGARISVERGRVKTASSRDRDGGRGNRGPRNGFGGPMRGGRDNNRDGRRSAPYRRDGGGDFDRRSSGGRSSGNGYGRGSFDRDTRPPPRDNYSNGGDRRPYMDDRRGGFGGDRGYMGPAGDGGRMYPDERPPYMDDRRPLLDERPPVVPYERRPPIDDRSLLGERRPPPAMNDRAPPILPQSYERRIQPDMYSRRDSPSKSMGGGYGNQPRSGGYDNAYPSMQPRGYAGGPGPRRDMGRRF